jgi:hypothetical protein
MDHLLQFSLVHQNQRINWLGEELREGFSLVLIGQRRNVNHGIQGENNAAHLRWKKWTSFGDENDDLLFNLMDDGSKLEDEGRHI